MLQGQERTKRILQSPPSTTGNRLTKNFTTIIHARTTN